MRHMVEDLARDCHSLLTAEIDAGRIQGGAACIRDIAAGEQRTVFVGRNSPAGPPVTLDSVVRIYSMTKPMLATVVLRLIDAGLLPGLDMSAAELAAGIRGLSVPAGMTLRQLLSMSSGLAGSKEHERMQQVYRAAGVLPFDYTDRGYDTDEIDFLRRIFGCELSSAPGTQWEYGRSADVAGLLIQHYLGTPIDMLFSRHLFEPLAMASSGFFLPPGVATDSVLQPPADPPTGESLSRLDRTGGFRSAGSGGLASLRDYLTFLEAVFIPPADSDFLSDAARAELLSDQIVGLHDTGPDYIPGPDWGFSLNVGISPRHCGPENARRVAWLGRAGTSFIIDLEEKLIMLFAAPSYGQTRILQAAFAELTYRHSRQTAGTR
ncbi:beta-lactamase family protein [Streptomyces sp. ISL-10]|uniref:serine hydrolase domain-containing protein n=1 Tax=Streptomyces sp. ISL-10 TaxID=2819172 RepID=UPI001BEC082E|nr:serine hydrolase domain-containing protein [Streptomyces sp. ISL-10]MBT2363976.1 beta-lactamase family protein [Streptomyces sp. ISL-10]